MRGWVAAAAVALVVGTVACDSRDNEPARWVSNSESRFGWTIRYPDDWRFDTTTSSWRVSIVHWTVANFDASSGPAVVRRARSPRGGTLEWVELPDRLEDFPPDGVAFRLGHRAGGTPPNYRLPEAQFPLRLADLRPGDEAALFALGLGAGDVGTCRGWAPPWCDRKPAVRLFRFGANGWTDLAAAIWIGPHASRRDRETASRVLESLRFERLRPGQVTRSGFHVLGYAREFGRSAIVRFERTQAARPAWRRGLFLFRRGSGLAAIEDPHGCRLRFDTRTRTFWCPRLGTRWDMRGFQVGVRPGELHTILLSPPVRVTPNGLVLVAFDAAVPLRRAEG